jgi:hypothetical protein
MHTPKGFEEPGLRLRSDSCLVTVVPADEMNAAAAIKNVVPRLAKLVDSFFDYPDLTDAAPAGWSLRVSDAFHRTPPLKLGF